MKARALESLLSTDVRRECRHDVFSRISSEVIGFRDFMQEFEVEMKTELVCALSQSARLLSPGIFWQVKESIQG